MATKYFQANDDGTGRIDFTDADNWFADEACTIPTTVGGASDDVIFVDGTADGDDYPYDAAFTWHGLRHEASFGDGAWTWTAQGITISGGELYWKPVAHTRWAGNAAAASKASFLEPCWGIASTTENIFDGQDGISDAMLEDALGLGGNNGKIVSGTTYWRHMGYGAYNNGEINGDVICDEGDGLFVGAAGSVSGNVYWRAGSNPALGYINSYGVQGAVVIEIETSGVDFRGGGTFELHADQAGATFTLGDGPMTFKIMRKGVDVGLGIGLTVYIDGLNIPAPADVRAGVAVSTASANAAVGTLDVLPLGEQQAYLKAGLLKADGSLKEGMLSDEGTLKQGLMRP